MEDGVAATKDAATAAGVVEVAVAVASVVLVGVAATGSEVQDIERKEASSND